LFATADILENGYIWEAEAPHRDNTMRLAWGTVGWTVWTMAHPEFWLQLSPAIMGPCI